MHRDRHISWLGLFHLSVVWVVWGATYLAIRFAVREGSGFPPFTMAGSRVLLAGLLLVMIGASLRQSLRMPRTELLGLIVSALLLWIGGNGLVTWAEQRAHSGYAALVVGTTPIWAAIIEAVVDRRRPSWWLVSSLLIGFVGLAVLTAPVLRTGERADWTATLALLAAPVCWGTGSILQQRRPVHLSPVISSGYQQLIGAIGFGALILLTGEPAADPTREAWLGWAFLLVFGSILAFTSYVMALRLLPISIVMTYAYVNPLMAVFLGWLLLDEAVRANTIAGTALILAGVAGVFHERLRARAAIVTRASGP
jgi:drug/metabolite transporter (DMT)-like permease